MKKVFKLLAIAMVVFSFASTVTSCKKDDEKSCCTMEAEGETLKFCEGDDLTEAAMEEDNLTWAEFKAGMEIFGATCD